MATVWRRTRLSLIESLQFNHSMRLPDEDVSKELEILLFSLLKKMKDIETEETHVPD